MKIAYKQVDMLGYFGFYANFVNSAFEGLLLIIFPFHPCDSKCVPLVAIGRFNIRMPLLQSKTT